jgi:predicted  nucleic acid-binding Zn-ribbon protein
VEDLLKQMLSEIKDIKIDIKELKENQNHANESLGRIESKLDDLEIKNANNHIETMRSLKDINETLDFLTHKENQTEKEVYTIKKRLEIIK